MLDLSRVVTRITQGQAPGEMTPVNAGEANAVEGDTASRAAPAPTAGGASAAGPDSAPDARAVADLVYELMRRDALIAVERTGK